MTAKKKMSFLEDPTVLSTDHSYQSDLRKVENLSASLVVLIGPRNFVGQQWSLSNSEIVLGRSAQSDILISDRSISRQHIKFSLSEDESQIFLENLSEKSPVLLNGGELCFGVSTALQDGDRIRLGNVLFKFFGKGNPEALGVARAHEMAYKDSLTKAYNRRGMEVKMSVKNDCFEKTLACLFFDLDHFKKINDSHGHEAGDYVLETLAQIVSDRIIRSEDCFVRYGGEEFCIFIPGVSKKNSLDVAERLRAIIEQSKFSYANKDISVTISIGVSVVEKASDWKIAISQADEALYEAKKAGRNKVSFKSEVIDEKE